MMKHTTIRALAIGTLLLLGAGSAALADGMAFGRSQAPAPLEGTWEVVISPYNCSTGVPVPGVTFRSRLSFHAGGTMTESPSNPSFQPGQRSHGLGYWERTGQTSYRNVLEAYIHFTSVVTPPATPRYQQGTHRIDQGIEMLDNDHWTSSALVTFRDTADNVVPPTGCMTAAGARLR